MRNRVRSVNRRLERVVEHVAPPAVIRRMRHRKWERRWSTDPDGFMWITEPGSPELRRALADDWITPSMRTIDIGCGAGEHSAWLAARGFDVTGIDLSSHAVDLARERHGKSGASFRVVDVSQPGQLPGEKFDALVDRGCLHGLPEHLWAPYSDNVQNWARPGAHMLLTMHTMGGAHPEQRRREVAEIFSPHFEVVDSHDTVIAHSEQRDLPGTAFRLRRNDP